MFPPEKAAAVLGQTSVSEGQLSERVRLSAKSRPAYTNPPVADDSLARRLGNLSVH